MRLLLTSACCAALLSASYGAYANGPAVPANVQASAVGLSAVLNETALACGSLSPEQLQARQQQQRSAAAKDMGIAPAEYDRLYASAVAKFQQQWEPASEAQKKDACSQLRTFQP